MNLKGICLFYMFLVVPGFLFHGTGILQLVQSPRCCTSFFWFSFKNSAYQLSTLFTWLQISQAVEGFYFETLSKFVAICFLKGCCKLLYFRQFQCSTNCEKYNVVST